MSEIDKILRGLGGVFGRVLDEVTPTCACGARAVPRKCFVCGAFACLEHAYLNAQQMTSGGDEAVICAACATDRPMPKAATPQKPSNWHWTLLGLDPRRSTAQDIERRFRDMSKTLHPDHGGDEHEFKRAATARALALEDVKRRKG